MFKGDKLHLANYTGTGMTVAVLDAGFPKVNTMSRAIQNSVVSRQRLYSATPYTIGFALNIYAKNQDDALQVVEQILPYFTPQYTVTVKPFADIPSLLEDVPITFRLFRVFFRFVSLWV